MTVDSWLASLTCKAQYDGGEHERRTAKTHTCDRPAKHRGDHHCPLCGQLWRSR